MAKFFKLGEVSFIDAQSMAREHPNTFEAPNQDLLDEITVGEIVQVCDGNERFWTVVTDIDSDGGVLTARVNNHLVGDQPYVFGDLIQYERRHIYNIHTKQFIELMKDTINAFKQIKEDLDVVEIYDRIEEMMEAGVQLEFINSVAKAAATQ